MSRIKLYGPNDNPNVDPPFRRENRVVAAAKVAAGEWVMLDKDSARMLRSWKPVRDQDKWARLQDWFESATALPVVAASGICEICGFSRLIEKCHIVPARFGGPAISSNLLDLCPNHHSLFDRNMLTTQELRAIWPKVSAAVNMRSSDPMLTEWRDALCTKYGVSSAPS